MRKLSVAEAEIMGIAVQQEIARSEESRYDHRLHGVLLVSRGLDCHRVAEYLGQNPVTVQRWVNRFNQRGFAGLQEGERSGQPRILTESQWSVIEADLRRAPSDFGYAQNLWDGNMVSHHLERRFSVSLGVRQCQRLFRQMGFRRRKLRPLIAQADPAAQAAYKRTAPPGRRRKD